MKVSEFGLLIMRDSGAAHRELVRRFAEHKTRVKVAESFGCGGSALYRWMRKLARLGYDDPRDVAKIRHRRWRRVPDELRDRVVAMYATGKFSQEEIARRVDLSPFVVTKILKPHGLPSLRGNNRIAPEVRRRIKRAYVEAGGKLTLAQVAERFKVSVSIAHKSVHGDD